MELKGFVKTALVEITDAVSELNDELVDGTNSITIDAKVC